VKNELGAGLLKEGVFIRCITVYIVFVLFSTTEFNVTVNIYTVYIIYRSLDPYIIIILDTRKKMCNLILV